MGSKYTIQAWGYHGGEELRYMVIWEGENFGKAVKKLQTVSGSGKYGCVTLECR